MKSYVTMEQHACIVCGKQYDTGTILLDKRMRERFNMHTVTGYGMCPEHQKLRDDGYIALIEGKPPNGLQVGKTVRPNDINRTGTIVHIKREVFEHVINIPVPENMVCFVDPAVVEVIRKLQSDEG